MTYPWLLPALSALTGLAVGSFLNVVIHRTPRGENIAWPGSHCPDCGQPLRWYHNIPLISWIILGGKCAFCGNTISWRYPLVELLSSLLWLILFFRIGPVWHFPFVASSFSALLALTVIDFKYLAVPDSINFFALAMALIQPGFLTGMRDAAIAAGGLWLLAWLIGKAKGREAMGGADVIVAGTMAALLGLTGFFAALFISALLAIVPSLMAKDTVVPFVPFLSLGTLIVYLFEENIMHWLRHLVYG